ncbi:hypothetical protein RsoM2USA_42 [Ralstonia phage RsoM2USA]|nr:hypothetical protein RsoM2USA_42 [Ralstonia phage RsoM2USA]
MTTTMRTQYRFYALTNLYISDIQRGIQTAHAVSEMLVKYRQRDRIGPNYDEARRVYLEWAEKDKTIIVLQGGPSGALDEAHDQIKKLSHKLTLPFVKFYEDEHSLNGALTAVGVIVPDYVYDYYTFNLEDELPYETVESALALHTYLREFKLA